MDSLWSKGLPCGVRSRASHPSKRPPVRRARRSGDELHVVSVAPPVPVPVVDEMAAPTLAAYGHSQWQKDKEASMEAAKICCEAAIQEAVSRGVPRDSIWYRPLVPEVSREWGVG